MCTYVSVSEAIGSLSQPTFPFYEAHPFSLSGDSPQDIPTEAQMLHCSYLSNPRISKHIYQELVEGKRRRNKLLHGLAG